MIPYILLVLGFSISGCTSQKKLSDKAPFEIGPATCQPWTESAAEEGSGLLLEIPILSKDLNGAQLKQAYFRGKIANIDLESLETGWVARANFREQNMEKPDIIMHSDPKMEIGNRPPQPKKEFPFVLETDQCVLSYMEGETLKYVKIEGIVEKNP